MRALLGVQSVEKKPYALTHTHTHGHTQMLMEHEGKQKAKERGGERRSREKTSPLEW